MAVRKKVIMLDHAQIWALVRKCDNLKNLKSDSIFSISMEK